MIKEITLQNDVNYEVLSEIVDDKLELIINGIADLMPETISDSDLEALLVGIAEYIQPLLIGEVTMSHDRWVRELDEYFQSVDDSELPVAA